MPLIGRNNIDKVVLNNIYNHMYWQMFKSCQSIGDYKSIFKNLTLVWKNETENEGEALYRTSPDLNSLLENSDY